jgi:predicted metallo-beta-lactamase superfamily hydrolase
MNAYEIDIWRNIKHNGKFFINDGRTVVIHARNQIEAKNKIRLAEAKTNKLDGLLIEVSAEFIHGVTKVGTVRIEKYYVYSNGRYPISVEDFKRRK